MTETIQEYRARLARDELCRRREDLRREFWARKRADALESFGIGARVDR